MQKNILGLDLGTNSIGWAIVAEDEDQKRILHAGSRIIPMDAALMGDFESGNSISQTANRTAARGARRLYERHALRRERLNRVLSILGFLPEHYTECLNRYGQLNKGAEPKLAWQIIDGRYTFLFQESFHEMLRDFQQTHPELLVNGRNIAYDWTIYYLRKKALTQPITKQELAWILHQFNQKRGYNQARGEEEDLKPNERKELITQKVVSVRDTGEVSKGRTWYEVTLDNGMIYRRQSAYPLEWEGKTKDFIVTTKLNDDGTDATDKEGHVKRSISAPQEDDWGLRKIKTQHDIDTSGKTIGEFIYDALLHNPDQKILGQLVRVVDRSYYIQELTRILETQKQYIPELQDTNLYRECIHALYPHNEAYRNSIAGKDFTYLLLKDIIFYQRPLKSKKSLINECPYEYHLYRDKDGTLQRQYLKCISKSHPLYEEFRMWQFVENMHIYREAANGLSKEDCTAEYISDKANLVTWLLTQKEVGESTVLTHLAGKQKKGLSWNYVSDKKYPAATVTATLTSVIQDAGGTPDYSEIEHIWHILYSVSDKAQLTAALKHYEEAKGLSSVFSEKLGKQKPFDADYGAYSEKAIRRLLSLMRSREYWNEESIDAHTKARIEHLLTGEVDDTISARVREKMATMNQLSDFQGLPLWMAEYVVYDVRKNDTKWDKPEDIDAYIQSFRLHSLNNPIVEQVVMESLRTVRDIWRQEGHIDEIHIEMGRELKQNAKQRKEALQRQQENENANLEAERKLVEFLYPKKPSVQDIKKYRLWVEQNYVSPYTGQPIPLAQLFTSAYQIEHVIPQSRFFDDSMTNKVICEAEVNARKDRMLGHEFIVQCSGEKITLTGGKVVQVLSPAAYEDGIKQNFAGNKRKQEKLMLDDIPETFVARQMNDSRYISRLMLQLLSNIVREKISETEYEPESTSKNVIACNGATTTRLKKDWGINDVWNRIILPRFERLNRLQNTSAYTAMAANGHMKPTVPIELRNGFEKKRIDHRHHAMDAIVIAFTTRSHVALLSNESALNNDERARYDLQTKLRKRELWRSADGKEHTKFTDFIEPYEGFQKDVQTVLENIIVSFKQNLRVINKSNNRSLRFVDGKKQMVRQTQGRNWSIRKSLHKATVFGEVNLRKKKYATLSYALQHIDDIVERDVRTKLRELVQQGMDEKQIKKYFASNPTILPDVNLRRIEVYYYTNDTNDRYYAVRKPLSDAFTADYITDSITSDGVRRILLAQLERCNNDPKQAFSADGIEQMNADIVQLNRGVPHKPIYRVRTYEKADKFAVGQTGAKSKKFVEADKGTKLFTFVYERINNDGTKSRKLVALTLIDVVNAQKDFGTKWIPSLNEKLQRTGLSPSEWSFAFVISPGDLVYVPSDDEIKNGQYVFAINRIYKVVSLDGENPNFIPANIASMIVDGQEFTRHNKTSRDADGRLIKEFCIPIKTDRLGNIIKI